MCCDTCCTYECDREHVDDPEYIPYFPDAAEIHALVTDAVEHFDFARYGAVVTPMRPGSFDARTATWRRELIIELTHEIIGAFIESR